MFHPEPLFISQSSQKSPRLRVVLLHGLGGESSIWDELRELLEAELSVETVAFDLAGQGRSSRMFANEQLTVVGQAALVAERIAALPMLPTIVVGHCYGSLVTLALAEQLDNVQLQILISTGSRLPMLHWLSQSRLAPICAKVSKDIAQIFPTLHISSRRDFTNDYETGQFSIKRLVADVLHTSVPTYVQLLWNTALFPAEKFLQQIAVPTHIFQGTKDVIFSIQSLKKTVSKNAHVVLHSVAGAHHVLVLQSVRTSVYRDICGICALVLKRL